jgi:low affinity Fe/Cu permease
MPNRSVEHHEGDGPLERSIFASFARWIEQQLGRSTALVLAILAVVLWAVTGPFFGWSDTWQLVINTGTTIVTFLMVFVIQNTQNRDTKALQLKLDELSRVNQAARNSLISLEESPNLKSRKSNRHSSSLLEGRVERREGARGLVRQSHLTISGSHEAGLFRGLDETAVGATANAAAIIRPYLSGCEGPLPPCGKVSERKALRPPWHGWHRHCRK